MPMDCCHILLGRPWSYDKKALHDGRLNRYTIWVNGVNDTLFPLIAFLDEISCTTIRICMVSGK